MKGVTRKERIINAMLEGDASACAGVSREERNLAKVAKATCDGQLGGGSGGGWDAVITWNNGDVYDQKPPSDKANFSLSDGAYDKLHEILANGGMPRVLFHCIFGNGSYHDYTTAYGVMVTNYEESYDSLVVYFIGRSQSSNNYPAPYAMTIEPDGVYSCRELTWYAAKEVGS